MSRVEKLEYRGIRYLLYYPKNYIEGKKYPVMFHLHGAGSRGTDFKEFEGSTLLNILMGIEKPTKGKEEIRLYLTDFVFFLNVMKIHGFLSLVIY